MLFGQEPGRIKKLLVVEDEPLIAFDNEHFLATHGYEVIDTIDSAEAAKPLIAAGGIDLILCDISLNNSDGREVAIAARDAAIPVLFVTAKCPVNARGLAIGCLAKPYMQKDLKLAIEAVTAKLDGDEPKKQPKGMIFYE